MISSTVPHLVPHLVKLYETGFYGIFTARKDSKRMPEMPVDNFEYLYSN